MDFVIFTMVRTHKVTMVHTRLLFFFSRFSKSRVKPQACKLYQNKSPCEVGPCASLILMKPTIEGFTDFLLFLRTPYPRPLQTAEGKVACVTCPPITKDWTKSLANLKPPIIDWVCFYQIINFDKILDNLLTFVLYCSSSTLAAFLTLIILFLKKNELILLKNYFFNE